jgi:hypothetical protein
MALLLLGNSHKEIASKIQSVAHSPNQVYDFKLNDFAVLSSDILYPFLGVLCFTASFLYADALFQGVEYATGPATMCALLMSTGSIFTLVSWWQYELGSWPFAIALIQLFLLLIGQLRTPFVSLLLSMVLAGSVGLTTMIEKTTRPDLLKAFFDSLVSLPFGLNDVTNDTIRYVWFDFCCPK